MTIIPSVIAVLSLAALIVREIMKAYWGKEFAAAKQAQIEVLQSQIQMLQDITPMRMQEYLKSTQEVLGEQIEDLHRQLYEARDEIPHKQELASKVSSLEIEKAELEGVKEVLYRLVERQLTTYAPTVLISADRDTAGSATEPVYVPEDDKG